MILDEICEAIREYRINENLCPFPWQEEFRCDWCTLLFPDVFRKDYIIIDCPCYVLDYHYVKSEMRRLFP